MPIEHYLIVIAGLGDENKFLRWEVKGLEGDGLTTHLYQAPWENKEPFEPKLERLLRRIDELSDKGNVSLVGISAGGSLALNAFDQRRETIHKLVTVCAPLRQGRGNWFWNEKMKNHSSFRACLVLAEQNQVSLTPDDKKKILTTQAIYDEQIPNSTASIPGVEKIVMPVIGHQPGITLALTLFKGRIIQFVKG